MMNIKNIEWSQIDLPPIVRNVPAMLGNHERALYYCAARDWYTFSGQAVDCGVLVGGTTLAMLHGMLDNPLRVLSNANSLRRVYAYDRFLVSDGVYVDFFRDHFGIEYSLTDSFEQHFRKNVAPFAEKLDVHVGDITQMSWPSERGYIELLGLDVCKGEHVGMHVAVEFFPYLKPQESIVIQQDYAHIWQPNAIYIMEIFGDKFEKKIEVESSAVFKCVGAMEREEVIEKLEVYRADRGKLLGLMDVAITKADSTRTRWFLEIAKAKLMGDNGDANLGLRHLDDVRETFAEFMDTARRWGIIYGNMKRYLENLE